MYLYASCDRAAVHPRLGQGLPVLFRDRFTGREHTPADADVRAIAEMTAANELDVLAHNVGLAERHGPALYRLFARSRDLLSAPAWNACAEQLARYAPEPGIVISGLDHLVLTVTDVERTTAFYQRVLGMRPVTFGEGRGRWLRQQQDHLHRQAANSSPTPPGPPLAAPTCVWSPGPHRNRCWPIWPPPGCPWRKAR